MHRLTLTIPRMSRLRWNVDHGVALVALLAAMSVLALLPASRGDAATRNVNVGQNSSGAPALLFNPTIQSAIVGDTVHFVWFDGFHTATSYDESSPGTPQWQSPILTGAGQSFDHVFPTAGVFAYYCSIHSTRNAASPANIDASIASGLMVGKIIVSSTVGGVSEQVDGSTLAVAERDSSEPPWMYYAGAAAIVVMLSSAALVLRLRRRRIDE